MNKKIIAVLLTVCLLALGLAGCTHFGDIVSNVTAGEFPVEVEGVTISARPSRVAVLSGSLADVVLALGRETQLVAVCNDADQPNLSSLTKVDPRDIGAITELSPDLVLVDASQSDVAGALTETGLTVLVISPATDREDFERLYAQVSTALVGGGVGYDQGIDSAQDVFTTLDDINRIVPKEKVTTACYLYDTEGSGVTGDMLASTVMSYAGVTNIFRSLTGGRYDFDSLRVSNPDVIFCAPGVKAALLSDSRFENFQAVRNDRIYELDPSLVEWQGRTVVTLAYEISAASFPELLEENSSSGTDPIDTINSQVNDTLDISPSPSAQPDKGDTSSDNADDGSADGLVTLTEGDTSEAVFQMQRRLEELGYLEGDYNGYFGEYTAECLMIFQETNGLPQTGIADPETLVLLFSDEAIPAVE